MRVRLHPASDAFARGVRYGEVLRASRNTVTVHGLLGTVKVSPGDILPLEDSGSLYWSISLPSEGPVDETFSDDYRDALSFARELHGPHASITLIHDR